MFKARTSYAVFGSNAGAKFWQQPEQIRAVVLVEVTAVAKRKRSWLWRRARDTSENGAE